MGMRGEWWDGESLGEGRGEQSERGAAETTGGGGGRRGVQEKKNIHNPHIFSLPVAD